MDLNLDEICEFFKHPQQQMPKSILGAVCTGHRFTRGNLETGIIELNSLRLWAPEIAKQIKPEGNGQAPYVRKIQTPFYQIYHPSTGKYCGSFDINSNSVTLPK
jgi:hypothetical protein